jgi:hypothetical protein
MKIGADGLCFWPGSGVDSRAFAGPNEGDEGLERTWGVGGVGEWGGRVCRLRKFAEHEQQHAERHGEAAPERLLGPSA